MAHDVFISYASADRASADAVCAALEREGLRAWMAPRDIAAGASWGEAIIDAINASRVMVILFSSSSNASVQVMREVERAVAKRVPVIPFRIENVLPSKSMEYFLSSSHWMDAYRAPLEPHLEALAAAVKRFMAGQAELPATQMPHAAPSQRRLWIAAATGLVLLAALALWLTLRPPAGPPAIAVLPFKNLAHDPTIDYLSLALPAELNSQLSRTSGAIIRPLDAVKGYKDKDWSAPEVAKALDAGTVVGGTFWRSDKELRMNIDIIDSRQNRQVWSESFQALIGDLLKLVDAIVPKVAAALRLRLEAKADQGIAGTRNPEVYEVYLRGLALNQEITEQNNGSAIRLLGEATKADPSFAHAHSALSEAYVTRFYWNFSNDAAWLDRAEESARTALKLDASLPEARYALAYALEGKGQRSAAVQEYFESLKAGPNHAPAVAAVARWLFYMGDFKRSIERLDQLLAIDPTRNIHVRKAMCLYFLGRTSDALTANREAEKRAAGVDQLTLVAFTYSWLKEFDSAERVLARLLKEDPKALSAGEVRAWLYTMRGNVPAARKEMELIAQRPTYGIADEIATLYAIQGEREKAVEWLAKAVAAGAPNYAWYSSEFFKALRGDPRYEALIRKLADEYRPLLAQAPAKR